MSGAAWAQMAMLLVVLAVSIPLLGGYMAKVYGGGAAPGSGAHRDIGWAWWRLAAPQRRSDERKDQRKFSHFVCLMPLPRAQPLASCTGAPCSSPGGAVRRAVIDGANLSAALAAENLFPELFTDMMAVGEQTGHFAQTMQTIADVYERELDRTVQITSAMIPPVIIVMIAIVVGFVVFSILSAVFDMTQSLQLRPQ